MPAELKRHFTKASIPDAMLYKPASPRGDKRQYTIVEIKYCRDTQPEEQEKRAEKQHKELITTIQQYDPTAEVKAMHIAVGRVWHHLQINLWKTRNNLGVTGSLLKGLVRRLHLHAVRSMTSILQYRWRLMDEHMGIKGRHKDKRKRAAGQEPRHRKATRRRRYIVIMCCTPQLCMHVVCRGWV